jgi:hypothetical protein
MVCVVLVINVQVLVLSGSSYWYLLYLYSF